MWAVALLEQLSEAVGRLAGILILVALTEQSCNA